MKDFILWAAPGLIRASCMATMFIAVLSSYVLIDLWRVERRQGRILSSAAIALVGMALIFVSVIFGRCALTGCYPTSCTEAR